MTYYGDNFVYVPSFILVDTLW